MTGINLKEFRTFQELDISLSAGPGVLIVLGSNGLGKSSLFDAIEWTLTGEIDHFTAVDGSEKVGNYLCRWGSAGASSSRLKFSDGEIVGRELYGKSARTSTLTDVQDIAGYLRAEDWSAPIVGLGRYLSLTHFLGQSTLSRLTHRSPSQRLEILREVSQSNSLQEFGARLHGLGTTTPARAFGRRVSQLQRDADSLSGAIEQENDLWLASRAAGALDDLEALGLAREIEALLSSSSPLISGGSQLVSLEAPLEISQLELAIDRFGESCRRREHSLLEARRLLQAKRRNEGLRDESLATLQGAQIELVSTSEAVVSAQDKLGKRQELLESASRSYSTACERHAGLAELRDAIAYSEKARADRQKSEANLLEIGRLLADLDEAVDRSARWVQFQSQLERGIEDLAVSLESSRSRVSVGRSAIDHVGQLSALDARLEDFRERYDNLDDRIERANSELEVARAVESEAKSVLELVEQSVGALSGAVAMVAEYLSDDEHDCPVCSTHFDSVGELHSRANSAALRLAPKVVAQQQTFNAAQTRLVNAENAMRTLLEAASHMQEMQSQRNLVAKSKADLLETIGLLRDAQSSEIQEWISSRSREIERMEFLRSRRASWLDRVLRSGRSRERASEALRERDKAALQQERAVRESEANARTEHIAFDQLASVSGRLFPNGHPDHDALVEEIGNALKDVTDTKAAYDIASREASEQSLRVGVHKANEAQLGARISTALNAHSVALDALAALSSEWLGIGLQPGDMSEARVEMLASDLNRGNRALQEADALLNRFRDGREAWSRQLAWRAAIDSLRSLVDLAPNSGREEIRVAAGKRLGSLQNDLMATKEARQIASTASGLITEAVNEFNADYLDPLKKITNRVNQAILCDPRIGIDFTVQKRGIKQSGLVVGEMPQGLPSVDPALVHSEGQMAGLAVSMLCGASLTYPWSRWRALVLDDPLQHNDTIHASAFADLSGSLILEKGYQVFLTTHDLGQAEFLQRKFLARGIECSVLNLLGRGNNGVEWSYRSSSDGRVTSDSSAIDDARQPGPAPFSGGRQ
ncbi:MAG: AAA family ATPase [Stenotrophomonas sp.]